MIRTIKITCIILILSTVLRAETDIELLKNRVFFSLSSFFSAEISLGYERRLSDLLGLSLSINGGQHILVSQWQSQLHIGPRFLLPFYFLPLSSRHQLYISPGIEIAYGRLSGGRDTGPNQADALTVRLLTLAGYRYSFQIPMDIDVGLGGEPFSMIISNSMKMPLYYHFIPIFGHVGVGYRF